MVKRLQRWKRGDKFSAGHLNEAVEVADKVNPITGAGGISVVQGTTGTVISSKEKTTPRPSFRALITGWMGSYARFNSTGIGANSGFGVYSATLIQEVTGGVATVNDSLVNDPNVPKEVQLIQPGDALSDVADIVVWNEFETNSAMGGFLQPGDIVEVSLTVKVTNESTPRKIYRTYVRPQITIGTVTGTEAGAGTYTLQIEGTGTSVPVPTNPATDFVAPGGPNSFSLTGVGVNIRETAVPAGTHWVPVGAVVLVMVFNFTTDNRVAYRFEYDAPLSVGYYCQHPTVSYGDTAGIDFVSFAKDDFIVASAARTVGGSDHSRALIDWRGISIIQPVYSAADTKVCAVKILEFVDDRASSDGQPEPTSFTRIHAGTTVITDTGYDQFPAYLDINSTTHADGCAQCSTSTTKQTAAISANVYIDPCLYKLWVEGCHDGSGDETWKCTKVLKFGPGFNVSGATNTEDTAVTVDLELNVDSGSSSYMQITDDSSDCGKTIKICTANVTPSVIEPTPIVPGTITPTAVTVVTGVSCSDGMLSVTTADIYVLASGSAFYVLPDSSTLYTFTGGGSRYGFPSSSSIKVFGVC